MAQGVANVGSIFFSGIPATGAIARTATNIKSGAKTPVAGMIHAVTLFLIILFFAPLVSKIPLAALSAVLIMVAWNMSEAPHFLRLFKAPSGDIAILLSAFLLTIFIDLTVAVEVGMILAAFLFMKRMGDLAHVIPSEKLFKEEKEGFEREEIPQGVEVYEIRGAFFFGAAGLLKDLLKNMERAPQVFILRMRHVPVIDASGLNALSEFYKSCKRSGTQLIFAEVRGDVAKSLKKYGLEELVGKNYIASTFNSALRVARELVKPLHHASH
jgi:SulP family sulfate permease